MNSWYTNKDKGDKEKLDDNEEELEGEGDTEDKGELENNEEESEDKDDTEDKE